MILDEIVSIVKVGIKKTIDIKVSGPDSLFFCNGILTHNSGAGDTTEITEENVQGGISKVQAADNVIALIPDSTTREAGMMRAKILKSRDSSGVGKYIQFKANWSTLSFIPFEKDEDDDTKEEGKEQTFHSSAQKKKINGDQTNNLLEENKTPNLRRDPKKKVILSEDNKVSKSDIKETLQEKPEENKEEPKKVSTANVIRGLKGKNKPFNKKIIKNI